jgi:hypothetical protein
MKNLIFSLLMLQNILSISAIAQENWTQDGNTSRGRFLYNSAGALGFGVRTAAGGGWAWQLIDGSNNAYVHVQYPSGNVGIGTISPSAKLNVYNSSNKTEVIIGNPSTATGGFTSLLMGTSADTNGFGYIEAVKSSGSAYGDVIISRWGGNVGIGTTIPSEKLEVNGNINVGLNSGATTGYGNRLNLRGLDDAASGDPMWLARYNVGANQTELRVNIGDDSSGDDAFTVGNFFHGDGQWKTFLKVFNNGNVGIGTTTPSEKLEVNGNLSVGLNGGAATGYGNRLNLRGVDDAASGDPIWLARYNTAANQTELRVNIGDDVGQAQDMFVVGTHHWNGGTWYPHLAVQASGNVGIGTVDTKGYKLAVAGKAIAEEVTVKLQAIWPDYVFEPTYDLKPLAEIEAYIKENKHLPEVPSAKEMEANGVQLGEMNMLLLKKVEELTLYVIEQQKQIAELKKTNDLIVTKMKIQKQQ